MVLLSGTFLNGFRMMPWHIGYLLWYSIINDVNKVQTVCNARVVTEH